MNHKKSKWPELPLSLVAERLGGGTPSRREPSYWGSPGIPWFTVANLSGESIVNRLSTAPETITGLGLANSSAKLIPPGSVIFSTRVVVWKVGIADSPLTTNQDLISFVLTPVLVNRFLAYFLLRSREKLRNHQKGATIRGISIEALDNLITPIPTESEQLKIVEILDEADRLRHLRAEADSKAERILPALFLGFFGHPIGNTRNWKTMPLGQIGTLERGISRHRPRNDPSLLGGPYPLIQTGEVTNCGGRIYSYSQTYSERGLQQSRLWPAGTLCITIAANIAQTGILEFDACFPDSVVGFSPHEPGTGEFIQAWLGFMRPTIEAAAPGFAQKNINLEILRRLPVIFPPRGLRESFSEQARALQRLRYQRSRSADLLSGLFNALLRCAFTGELTATWREAHMNELLQEMELQAKALASREARR